MRSRRGEGFTLVELLVVVAIIGLLMGILVPNLIGVKEKAAQAKCGSNLKGIGQACFMYSNDNNLFPHVGSLTTETVTAGNGAQTLAMLVQSGYYDGDPAVFICPSTIDKAESNPTYVSGKTIIRAQKASFPLQGVATSGFATCSYTFTARTFRQGDVPTEVLAADNAVRNPTDEAAAVTGATLNSERDNHPDGRNFLFIGMEVEFHRFSTPNELRTYTNLVKDLNPY